MICLFFYSLFCTLAHQTWVAIVIATKPVYTSYFQEALGSQCLIWGVKWHKLNEASGNLFSLLGVSWVKGVRTWKAGDTHLSSAVATAA